MVHEVITARNLSAGLEEIFFYINDVSGGLFINGFLLAVWCIVTFGLYFSQRATTASGDFPMAAATAGFITSIITVLLRMITTGENQLIPISTIGVVFFISFISVMWFWLSRQN